LLRIWQINHVLAKKRDKIDEPRPSNPENTIDFHCNFSTTDFTAEALSTLIAHARLTSHFIERINRYRTKWNHTKIIRIKSCLKLFFFYCMLNPDSIIYFKIPELKLTEEQQAHLWPQ